MRPFPEYRAAGLLIAGDEDASFLWREAQQYFSLAAQTVDPVAAERLSRLGAAFASMAIALLQGLARANQEVRDQIINDSGEDTARR